ncbi:MAG: UDP-N-acetylglucosamine 2-epimerase (hydrolyzing) [Phycisphaerales bacterium]|nr:UDP-N-acetylglucosamine 2-epimerase (hydrolyzing) [Phycisphaerales bacterium]
MIGDGWDGEPAVRPGEFGAEASAPGRALPVMVVTGSRADFGLLTPVMRAIEAHPSLDLLVVAAGSHLVMPALTFRDVKAEFPVSDSVPMQVAGRVGRSEDVEAVGVGIGRFGRSMQRHNPDWVVVLGDRIEAFAAAAAASIGGRALAHIHGGDRAEGVADEAMRHAITKLAHLHLAATEASAQRIIKMGEKPELVRVIGSPAVDGLGGIEPLSDTEFKSLGEPEALVLMHPIGRHPEEEEHAGSAVFEALGGKRVLALWPNFDPGRQGTLRAIHQAGVKSREHLPRVVFVGLLKKLAGAGGLLVGNSSAALIEAAAVGLPAVDVGQRQAGRERAGNVVHAERETPDAIREAVDAALQLDRSSFTHPYGEGDAGKRAAESLASVDPRSPALIRKRCVY